MSNLKTYRSHGLYSLFLEKQKKTTCYASKMPFQTIMSNCLCEEMHVT